MSARDVARQALAEFEKKRLLFSNGATHAALNGYFRGVCEGKICVGQSWVASLLINSVKVDSHVIDNWSKEQLSLLEEIFASGMCCDGQQLDGRSIGR